MKEEIGALHSFRGERVEHLRSEVESRRWRRHRSALVRIHSLVPLDVGRLIRARDVRRKRDVSVLLDRLFDRQWGFEQHDARAPLGCGDDLNLEVVGDVDHSSRLELPAGMHHRLPRRFAERSKQQNFSRRAVLANAKQSGAKDAGGVEHDRVAGGNELLKIAELLVRDLAGRSVDDHQPAVAASRGWLLRDAIGGELEVVMGSAGAVLSHSATPKFS